MPHRRATGRSELVLLISSEGGDLDAAFALIDIMGCSGLPIKTVGMGSIASCGLLIFLAGTKGRRVLLPSTSVMSHQFHCAVEGKMHELFASFREFRLTEQRMLNHYLRCTSLDEAAVRTYLIGWSNGDWTIRRRCHPRMYTSR